MWASALQDDSNRLTLVRTTVSQPADTTRTRRAKPAQTTGRPRNPSPATADAAAPPAERTPGNKGQKYPAEVLRPEEVTALLRACSTRAPSGIRNRALIAVLYRGGLRLAEALALYPKDVDLA